MILLTFNILFIAEFLLIFLLVKISRPKSTVSLNKLLTEDDTVLFLYSEVTLLDSRAFVILLSVILNKFFLSFSVIFLLSISSLVILMIELRNL